MHMRKLCLLLCFFLTAAVLAAQPTEQKRHMLWQVQGSKGTVYLAGSFHLLTEDVYPLDSIFVTLFEESDMLVLEIPADSLQSPAAQRYMLQKGLYQDGGTLADAVPESLYVATSEFLSGVGVPIAMFQKARPWFMAMTLSVLQMQKLGFRAENGLDFYFADLARKAGKPITGLETVAEQLAIFAGMPDSLQAAFLQETLSEIGTMETSIKELLAAWKQGDAEKIAAMLFDSMSEFPALQKRLLRDRNERWVEKIIPMLEQGKRAYIVVGAGHLAGEFGLPTLLRQQGYRVTQL